MGWDAVREAFGAAAGWFAATVGEVRDWDAPGLGEWTVRDLVGHTGRALLTVETYLAAGADEARVTSAVGYFGAVLAGSPADVAARGRAAGVALGPDPAGSVAAAAERVVGLVVAAGPDALAGTPAGGMRLVDYLPTRTVELTVHTADLAVALGRSPEPPPVAAAATFTVLGALAAATGRAAPLLLATTGRGPLPPGYTVL